MGGFGGGVGTDEQEDTGGISPLAATATEFAQLFLVLLPVAKNCLKFKQLV